MQRVLLRLLILVLLSGLVELKFTFTIPDNPNCLSDASGRFFCHSPPPPCQSMRHHYDLRQKETVGYRSFLLYGHNGLRNRLAIKLNTVDMLHVTWDDKLAELSNRHHRHCHRQMHDSQEETINNSDEWMLYRRVFSGKNNLSRNSFFWPNIYLNNILETAVGTWYSRHQQLKYPKKTKYKERDYLVINGDNSFTHIINPQTYRMGCSYANFNDGLSLICYYFPYARYNHSIFLRKRSENYQCPFNFPMPDPIFQNLCRYANYILQTAEA